MTATALFVDIASLSDALGRELPDALGLALWDSQALNKGAGHKYIRRVATGVATRPWKYFYTVGGGAGGLGHESELTTGSKFQARSNGQAGHFEITGADGNLVSIHHDVSGQHMTITKAEMQAMLRHEHVEKIDAHKAKLKTGIEASTKRTAALKAEAGKFEPAKAPGAGRTGSETTLYVAGSGGEPEPHKASWRLVEADEAIASNDPTTFAKRKDYPEGLQERAYHRDKSEQQKVEANAKKLRPDFVINTNPDATNGAPIVNAKGVVLGGNSRTMSMQRAYKDGGAKADELRAYIQAHAHTFGIDPEVAKGMKNPILVRQIATDSPEHEKLLVRQLNEGFTQGQDPRVQAVAMGRRMDEKLLEKLADTMEPDQTLSEFLDSPASELFRKQLDKAGIIDKRNANQYVSQRTGKLNEDGKQLIERVLVGKMVDDPDLLSDTPASMVASLARAVPFMIQAESAGKEYGLREELKHALDAYVRMQSTHGLPRNKKDADKAIAEWKGQQDWTETHPIHTNPKASILFNVLVKRGGPQQLADVFRRYADAAKHRPEGQGSMIGGGETSDTVFNDAVARSVGAEDELAKLKAQKAAPAAAAPAASDEQASMFKSARALAWAAWGDEALDEAALRKAGGPYIGPKGGKWADPEHKVAWSGEQGGLFDKPGAAPADAEVSAYIDDMKGRGVSAWRSSLKGLKTSLDYAKKHVAESGAGANPRAAKDAATLPKMIDALQGLIAAHESKPKIAKHNGTEGDAIRQAVEMAKQTGSSHYVYTGYGRPTVTGERPGPSGHYEARPDGTIHDQVRSDKPAKHIATAKLSGNGLVAGWDYVKKSMGGMMFTIDPAALEKAQRMGNVIAPDALADDTGAYTAKGAALLRQVAHLTNKRFGDAPVRREDAERDPDLAALLHQLDAASDTVDDILGDVATRAEVLGS